MDCKSVREQIDGISSGQLEPNGAHEHLETCRQCAAFRAGRVALAELLGSLSRVGAPPDFEARLERRLLEKKASHHLGFWFGGMSPIRIAAVAVGLAVLLSAGAIFRAARFGPRGSSTAGAAVRKEGAIVETAVGISSGSTPAGARQSSGENIVQNRDLVANSNAFHSAEAASGKAPFLNPVKSVKARVPTYFQSSISQTNPRKINPIDASLRSAEVLNFSAGTAGPGRGRTMVLPFDSKGIAVQVLLADRNGAMRTASIVPVTFGAEDIIQPAGSLRSASLEKGVW